MDEEERERLECLRSNWEEQADIWECNADSAHEVADYQKSAYCRGRADSYQLVSKQLGDMLAEGRREMSEEVKK